jgi:PTS hybrid protein
MGVGLVFVSHSASIAGGLVELARQMAPDAALAAAGGTEEGRIGTSYARIEAAVREVDSGDGVVVIGDLGSAIMTAEAVADLIDPPVVALRVVDGPLVEGGVAAAVAAQSGADVEAVARAAARGTDPEEPNLAGPGDGAPEDSAEAIAELADPDGLHARPAADLVRLAATFDAAVRVNGVDARSLLAILGLGLRQGAEVRITARGSDAATAVDAVQTLLSTGRPEA